MTSTHWAMRAHAVCAAVAWCCVLNALWLAFTVLGGVVLGAGPATVAACVVARRRMRGDPTSVRDFARSWRQEFWRGNAVVTPMLAILAVLSANYAYFSALGPRMSAARLVTLAALVLAAGVGAYVGPMYAHYELPLRSYLTKATRFALVNPASTLIMVFVLAVVAFVTAWQPILLVTVSIGAWLAASAWLGVRFFQQNDDRLAAAADPRETPARLLPTEPLHLR